MHSRRLPEDSLVRVRRRRGDGGPGRLSAGFALSAMGVVGIAMLVLSCGDGAVEPTPTPVPTTVTVSPGSAALTALGETAQFTAVVHDQNGQVMTGAAVTWTTSDASVAAVNHTGLATAAANGNATITATAGSASGTAAVTVAQAPDSVTVLPAEATLAALGDTLRLAAEAFDANGRAVAGAGFSWASSDNAVATVDGSGLVTAVGNGTATITATVGDVDGESEITVAQPNPVSIPDANLRSVIEAALGKASGAPVYDIEMQTLTSLSAGGPGTTGGGIQDLTGLEYATDLRDLVLHSNTISDLRPLRALTKLQWLDLQAINHYYDDPPPPLDYSPLADLAELTRLNLGWNHTPDVSALAGLTKLTWLDVKMVTYTTSRLSRVSLVLNT